MGAEDQYDDLAEDILGKHGVGGDESDDDDMFGEKSRNRDEEGDKDPAYMVFDFRRGQHRQIVQISSLSTMHNPL